MDCIHAAKQTARAAFEKFWRSEAGLDAAGEATTAEEYLRRVRYEAVRCPQVVRADIDTAKFDSQRTNYIPKAALHEAPACPDWSIPSPQWVKQFVLEFHQLRAALQHMEEEHAGGEARWAVAW